MTRNDAPRATRVLFINIPHHPPIPPRVNPLCLVSRAVAGGATRCQTPRCILKAGLHCVFVDGGGPRGGVGLLRVPDLHLLQALQNHGECRAISGTSAPALAHQHVVSKRGRFACRRDCRPTAHADKLPASPHRGTLALAARAQGAVLKGLPRQN